MVLRMDSSFTSLPCGRGSGGGQEGVRRGLSFTSLSCRRVSARVGFAALRDARQRQTAAMREWLRVCMTAVHGVGNARILQVRHGCGCGGNARML
eukprot:7444808-Pyramimonas_sp.AAC.2